MTRLFLTTVCAVCLLTLPAFAQNAIDLQTSIKAGVDSGALTVDEAGKLQDDQARLDKMRAEALKNGKISQAEQTNINRLQTRLNQRILHNSSDLQTAEPGARRSECLSDMLGRNIHQQTKIEEGITSGALTSREAAIALRQQARIDQTQANIAENDRVSRRNVEHLNSLQDRAARQLRQDTRDSRDRDRDRERSRNRDRD